MLDVVNTDRGPNRRLWLENGDFRDERLISSFVALCHSICQKKVVVTAFPSTCKRSLVVREIRLFELY
jgi:hypothetical protein